LVAVLRLRGCEGGYYGRVDEEPVSPLGGSTDGIYVPRAGQGSEGRKKEKTNERMTQDGGYRRRVKGKPMVGKPIERFKP